MVFRWFGGRGRGSRKSRPVATVVVPPTPANVITNGGFADDTGWNGFWYSGKAVTGGKAVFTASPTYDDINQTIAVTSGKYYELTFTVSGRASGTVFGQLSGGSTHTGTLRSANGTFAERFLVSAGTNTLRIMLETSGTLSVDDVSLWGPYNTATVGGA